MTPRAAADSVLRAFRDSPWLWFVALVVGATVWVSRVESTQAYHDRELVRLDTVKLSRADARVQTDRILEALEDIRKNQDSLGSRLRDVICDEKPRFCR